MLAMVATGPEYLPVDAMASVKVSLDHDKGTVLNLVLLEDPDVPPCSGAMVESVWGRMPEELVERVLLFLPACSQARFRSVCKWRRELMTSFNFREETSSIALRRSRHPVCVLKCEALAHLMDESLVEQEAFELERIRNWFKVRKVEFPGLVLPPVLYWDSNVFTGADLPLVGVACREKESRHMRCWLLNVAERTWLELPRLLLPWDRVRSSLLVFWDFWLVSVPAAKGTDFRVLVLSGDLCLTYLHSYSSTSQEWRTTGYPRGDALSCESYEAYVAESYLKIGCDKALIGEGRHIVIKLQEDGQKMLRLSLEGLQATCCMLPDLPTLDCSSPLSHSEGDAVFAYGPVGPSALPMQGVFLYKLTVASVGESSVTRSNGQWECLFAQQLPPCHGLMVLVMVVKAQIIGHMVILLTLVKVGGTETFWKLAYHMLDRSWKWQSMQGMHPAIHMRHKGAYHFVCGT